MRTLAVLVAVGCGTAEHAAPRTDGGGVMVVGDWRLFLVGQGVLDASADAAGGVWAVTSEHVYYFPAGAAQSFVYDQKDGLARGWKSWQDTWFTGTPDHPATLPVTFSAVAGATAGQAVVGNTGAIADRLVVDPRTGAVQRVENLAVTTAQVGNESLADHARRVVATRAILADLDGAFAGTAYLGGWHGFSALHGLGGDCDCQDFEEHQHFIPGDDLGDCDSSGPENGCWDGDVWGLARTAEGDLWAGDRHFVQLLKQRSIGPSAGLFDDAAVWLDAIDVWPGVRDEVHGLAADGDGGLWVASEGNGLAHLAPRTHAPEFFADLLPTRRLHGVVVDGDGGVWIGTDGAGLFRHTPGGDRQYTSASSPLPSDTVNGLQLAAGRVYVSTTGGLAVFAP